jgi:hypothetical protein
MFIRHILSINPDKPFISSLSPFRDGRVITKVLLGVNDCNSSWKVYGEHEYWMKYVEKDYKQLLQLVKKYVKEFVVEQGLYLLAVEEERGIRSTKKA